MSAFQFLIKSFFFSPSLTGFQPLQTLECLRITWGTILKCECPGPTRTEAETEDFLTSTLENSDADSPSCHFENHILQPSDTHGSS